MSKKHKLGRGEMRKQAPQNKPIKESVNINSKNKKERN